MVGFRAILGQFFKIPVLWYKLVLIVRVKELSIEMLHEKTDICFICFIYVYR